MISFKKKITRFLFVGELLFFLFNFLFAPNGLPAILALQRENQRLLEEIEEAKVGLLAMEEQLVQWNSFPFYKEKVAREQLHMIKNDEIVYFNI